MTYLDEAQVEIAAVDYFRELGYLCVHGPEIAPDAAFPEREDYAQVVLVERLRSALGRINPGMPDDAIEEAVRKVTRPDSPSLIVNNRAFHRMLTDGVDVSWREDGRERHGKVWLIERVPAKLDANEFLVVNQFTVIEDPPSFEGLRRTGKRNRRPDMVVFVNGLPLAVIELKNPAEEKTTIRHAYNQLQTYKTDIPSLFTYNEVLVISDGFAARAGTLTSGWDRFMPWRTIDGESLAPADTVQLEVLVKGIFERKRFIEYVLSFIAFEDDGKALTKKAAAYHQYWAVNKAVECTVAAGRPEGDHRIGVVWHTQGSGKSLSMAFYAGKIIKHPAMENPTLVIITDRNDLDEQLYGTFSVNSDLLRQKPGQAESREHLKDLLRVASGGVVFTTLQKFEGGDALSERRNIVVIADEAHRSHYGFSARIDRNSGEIKYGMAKYLRDALPNAAFIGFTGTPLELNDKSTPAVFGDYIDRYDILRAVQDGATVPIYYESRLARIELDEDEKPRIDPEFEEITEGEEEEEKQKLKTKWAALEAMVGTDKRIGLVAEDLVGHFGKRADAMQGKGMVVCMSRRICVEMYNAIIKLRPEWHERDDAKGAVKIVMSGSAADEPEWQPHIRTKAAREVIARRYKDAGDPLRLVIVRDMWLTGFDCPSMHTMYLDKPMTGHNLMQAIARVNRVFKDKPGGLVVDYLGIADALKRALQTYTAGGGEGRATVDQEEAVAVMMEKYEVVCDMMHGFDYSAILKTEAGKRMGSIAMAMEFILGLDDGKKRYLQAVSALSKAFALAVPHEQALAIREEVGLFQEIRTAIVKATVSESEKTPDEMESAIRQLVSRSVYSTEVVDIFAAAGLEKPDISILSDEFLAEVRQLPQRNLALELLKKLINDEIKTHMRKNVVQARSFAEMLEKAVRKYQSRAIEAAQVIDELINLAKDIRKAQARGKELGLTDDEVAFYDALSENDSARDVMGDEKLRFLAQELVGRVKQNVSIDWQVRENARAQIRVLVKRILRQYGYPPDMQQRATELVLEQTEVLCKDWAEEASIPGRVQVAMTETKEEPFLRVVPNEGDKYRTCVPLYSLKAAAGNFGAIQNVEPDGWVRFESGRQLRPGMFVAQVAGKSMEPRIPDSAYCLFKTPVTGTRQGKIVIVQLRDEVDPESGERYTVKRYQSEKTESEEGWRHTRIVLRPENQDFEPIVLTESDEGKLQVVAELVQVLGLGKDEAESPS
ncbi:MAG: HsdR family type I site-specific deoxyribonuclease [Deltaproteobacteria bacterium]|nr:HsdR family type I site-specific deoxyribonuclease [Deltaproteobacteria bacterium]